VLDRVSRTLDLAGEFVAELTNNLLRSFGDSTTERGRKCCEVAVEELDLCGTQA
jgi:hypothetical protein